MHESVSIAIYAAAHCSSACTACGVCVENLPLALLAKNLALIFEWHHSSFTAQVCTLMSMEDGMYRHSPQVLYLLEMYQQNFVGATGSLTLDANGDRAARHAPFLMRNIQVSRGCS